MYYPFCFLTTKKWRDLRHSMRSFCSYMYFKNDGVIFDKPLIRIKCILRNGKKIKSSILNKRKYNVHANPQNLTSTDTNLHIDGTHDVLWHPKLLYVTDVYLQTWSIYHLSEISIIWTNTKMENIALYRSAQCLWMAVPCVQKFLTNHWHFTDCCRA